MNNTNREQSNAKYENVKDCPRYQNADGDGSNPHDFSWCDDCKQVHRI